MAVIMCAPRVPLPAQPPQLGVLPAYAAPLPTHASAFDAAARVGVQPAAELGHVQGHRHGAYVLCALRALPCQHNLRSWGSSLHTLLAPPPPPHAPSRRPAPHAAPLPTCFPFDAAVCGGVQPAAELGHFQRHNLFNHAGHVCGALHACPCHTNLRSSWVLPVCTSCAAADPTPLP